MADKQNLLPKLKILRVGSGSKKHAKTQNWDNSKPPNNTLIE